MRTPNDLRPRLVALLALAALATTAPLGAETDPNLERGFAPDKVFAFGEIDQVNLFNGNLMINLPLGGSHHINGGLSYGLGLSYNSSVWDFQGAFHKVDGQTVSYTAAYPNKESNAGLGWTVSLGKLFAASNGSPNWRYLGEDGSEHVFYPTLHSGEAVIANLYYTRDGSYLRLRQLPSTSDLQYEVEFPDGTIKKFLRLSTSSDFRVTQIRDRFGNALATTLGVNQWILNDGHRIHTVNFMTRPNGNVVVSSVVLAAFGGTTAEYKFAYFDTTISRSCIDDDPHSEGGTGETAPVTLLASLTLPDTSTYTFDQYNTTCFEGATEVKNLPGTLRKMTLPTRGSLEWTYRTYAYPVRDKSSPGEPNISVSTVAGVASKKVLNASGGCEDRGGVGCEWTYTPAGSTMPPGGPRTTTVKTPVGDETVHHFNQSIALDATTGAGWQYGLPIHQTTTDGAGRFLSRESYDGTAATGIKKRAVYLRYEHDRLQTTTFTPALWYNTNRRVASEKTVYSDDLVGGIAKFSETTSSEFDGLGHYRRAVTSGNFESGNTRTAYTALNPASGIYLDNGAAGTTYVPWPASSPWVLGTSTESWQLESGVTAKQQTCFEAATGFLQRRRVLSGAVPAATDLVTVYTRDSQGNVIREQHYGGDVQGLGTGALCSLALPADQYRVDHTYSRGTRATSRWVDGNGFGLPFYDLQLTIDANTGLPSSSWDVSGLRTDYEYDTSGRLSWEKPQVGHGAWSEYVYAPAAGTVRANVLVRQRANGSKAGAILAHNQFFFDFMGRLASERRFDAAGIWRIKETGWNSMGWKHTVSELGSTSKTEFKSYDPFGRPQTITPPDGTTHDVTMIYRGVREVVRKVRYNATNQISTTTERYDRQGRLYQVEEPSAPGGAVTTTSYSYDVGGRLAGVFMAGGGTNQGRSFVYDNRGFLLHERHPEKGPIGNGYVRYFAYDALGNPGRKVDAVSSLLASDLPSAEIDLTFTYDRASRLTHQYAKGVLSKTFEYGAANGAGDWRLGRLWRASRYNYVWLGPAPYTVRVEETYTFGGQAAAVTARATQLYLNGNPIEGFTQGWAYNDLGDVTTLTYPRCATATCNGASTTSRVVDFQYTNGWLTVVPSYASSIGYHPNGMVASVAHTDGTTYTQAADPHGMRRPASYTVTKPGVPMWQSGAYAYDGAGNVTSIGGAAYSYDAVSRLVSGTTYTAATTGGSHLGQTAVYDPFGNLTTLSTETSVNNWSSVSLPTSTSTNRLTSFPYDNSGAMTSWTGQTYHRDDLGLVWRYEAAGFSYVHIYTADDERVWTFHEGQNRSRWTIRDLDGKVLRELDLQRGNWVVQRDYVHRDGAPLAAVQSNGQINHLHPDHLGTPRLVTTNFGTGPTQVAFHAYHPYGTEATYFAQDDERMKFTGHERDLGVAWSAADDVDYMHARYYQAQVGRFLSVDPSPASVALREPQSWNRFSYGRGNPLKFIDPTGAIVEFADKSSQAAYQKYKEGLDEGSEDYANLVQLEDSEITFVINVEDQGGSNEGSVTFDGAKVKVNVDPGGPSAKMSSESRMAHELQHAVQVDNGEIGFQRTGQKWVARFTDITDELGGWNAGVRQATPRDLVRGPLAGYNRAGNKVNFLLSHGYKQYRERGTKPVNAPRVAGYAPGSILHTQNWFYRTGQ